MNREVGIKLFPTKSYGGDSMVSSISKSHEKRGPRPEALKKAGGQPGVT